MRITILGANGQTGAHLVRQALERGHAVSAVVRSAFAVGGVTVFSLDDLPKAVDGADAVLSAVGPRGRKDGPVAAPITRSLLEAYPTGRVIVISASPVGAATDPLNRFVFQPLIGAILKPVYDDLREMENTLAASSSAWTAFRPPRLTNGPSNPQFRTVVGANVPRGATLSRADLATAMLDALTRPETERQPVGIAN